MAENGISKKRLGIVGPVQQRSSADHTGPSLSDIINEFGEFSIFVEGGKYL